MLGQEAMFYKDIRFDICWERTPVRLDDAST